MELGQFNDPLHTVASALYDDHVAFDRREIDALAVDDPIVQRSTPIWMCSRGPVSDDGVLLLEIG